LQIWDTAGQDRFRSITKNYYKGSHGIILMYDVTSLISFQNIKNWIFQIREIVDNKVCILLVGNKIDDKENIKVLTEQGQQLANDYDINFIETSAKNDINVAETFQIIANSIYTSFFESNDASNTGTPDKDIKLGESDNNKDKKKNDCCK